MKRMKLTIVLVALVLIVLVLVGPTWIYLNEGRRITGAYIDRCFIRKVQCIELLLDDAGEGGVAGPVMLSEYWKQQVELELAFTNKLYRFCNRDPLMGKLIVTFQEISTSGVVRFSITVPGRDRKFGTKDDQTRKYESRWVLWNPNQGNSWKTIETE